jgi:LPXTG-motif cell wall-anchored protein
VRSRNRLLRAVGAAVVLSTTALATGPATAAAPRVPDMYAGRAQGVALLVEVHLPAPLDVPGVGRLTDITQSVSFTQSTAGKPFDGATTGEALARLADGSVKPLNEVLGRSTKASLGGSTQDSDAVLAHDFGLITVGVGELSSRVTPDTRASALSGESTASLARLSVGLGGLRASQVSQQLTAAAEQLTAAVATAEGSVRIAITGAVEKLDEVAAQSPEPVQQQIAAAEQTLTSLLAGLQTALGGLAEDASLVDLTLLQSTATVARAGARMTATATSSVGQIDVLGGLVHVDAVKTVASSSAGGVTGSAKADTTTTVIGAKVADLVDLDLTADGLSGAVLGQRLPAEAATAVDQALAEVNKLLATAGVRIVSGDEKTTASPDGKHASAESEGVGIIVDPLHASAEAGGKPLLALRLVPAGAAAEAGIAPTVKRSVTKRPPVLAQTGGNPSDVMALLAGALLVGLLLVRRRGRRGGA